MLWTQLKNLVIANTLDDRSADLLPLSTLLSAAKKHCHACQAHWNPFTIWLDPKTTNPNQETVDLLTSTWPCWPYWPYGFFALEQNSRMVRLTVETVGADRIWPLVWSVRYLWSVATAYKSRAWPWTLHIVFSIRRINIDTRLPL